MSAAGGSVAAVDLGATSGRVILGHVGPGEVHLEQVARFRNGPVRIGDALHWDVLGLWQDALAGLAAAVHSRPEVLSVGVDSWAVDYGLLRGGRLLGNPRHYRDERNPPAAEAVHQLVSPAELYTRNGLQFLPFNTLYQLYAEQTEGMLPLADRLLLIPDLLTYWLSGIEAAEATNASATGLLGVRDAVWDAELIERFGLRQAVFSEVVAPGTELGALDPQMAVELGRDLRVVTVGSHDTASAVVAVPASDDDFAYVSCGTWALVGVETERPVLTEGSRLAGFTNERGVDGRIRYLHNVMGLWLLNELVREWETTGEKVSLSNLLAQAEAVTAPVAVFDPDDASFMAPGPMPPRIAAHCREHDLPVPTSRAENVRSIVESLAEAFARTVREAARLSGKRVRAIHIVGGGAQNALLCQRTADRSGLPVLAGPVEATAIGNVLVQARTLGLIGGGLDALRHAVAAAYPPLRYDPRRQC